MKYINANSQIIETPCEIISDDWQAIEPAKSANEEKKPRRTVKKTGEK